MYHIVRKFELQNGEIVGLPIGYINDVDCSLFYETFETPFIDWVEGTNPIDQTVWFETNTHFYLIDSKEELPEGLELIIDINNPEGV